jgi:hypothetical protein
MHPTRLSVALIFNVLGGRVIGSVRLLLNGIESDIYYLCLDLWLIGEGDG